MASGSCWLKFDIEQINTRGKGEHKMNKRLEKTGYIAFFLSGICAISSGIIVSVLTRDAVF